MASHERMRNQSFFSHDDDSDDVDDGYVYGYGYGYGYEHHHHHQNLSRLSMCTLNSMSLDEEEDDGNGVGASMISMESFDGDADEEFSDGKETEGEGKEGIVGGVGGLSSDSDKEPGCYSLPATPPARRRSNRGGLLKVVGVKEYASENEAQKQRTRRRRRGKVVSEKKTKKAAEPEDENGGGGGGATGGGGWFHSLSGESEGAGLVVITRPKGGSRSLCMDMEEVKACRDLGFELEHERMLEMPTRISISGSTLETSSGGNSPIASWRISSPGDDPRDVKARLKVWAQAVALASTSGRLTS